MALQKVRGAKMKVMIWLAVSVLLIWELVALRDIVGYSLFIQNSLIVLSSSYFFYLLDVHVSLAKVKRQLGLLMNKTSH
ncbi:hypothetical protein [Halolactibacillus halophilus]|nr:hypothetical protein [Halolactibacillus halophilus]